MSDDTQRPIVIKRVKKRAHGPHSSAWKLAYSDFVTAMMAFFLLMWLLGSTTKAELRGIAEYFRNPLKVSLTGGPDSGASPSVLKGGGEDLAQTVGQMMQGATPHSQRHFNLDQTMGKTVQGAMPRSPRHINLTQSAAAHITRKVSVHPQRPINLKAARAELAKRERERLTMLKARIARAIAASPALRPFRNQILLDLTRDGLRIQIVDRRKRPMFAKGSVRLKPYARAILDAIATMLNGVPNRLSIAGHTDATPYVGGEKGYSNWELSADRANAARRELVRGGMRADRVLRVVGLAAAVPEDPANPFAPVNRRISITVLNKHAAQAIRNDDGVLHASASTASAAGTPISVSKQ